MRPARSLPKSDLYLRQAAVAQPGREGAGWNVSANKPEDHEVPEERRIATRSDRLQKFGVVWCVQRRIRFA
jgi:hypothetical protein